MYFRVFVFKKEPQHVTRNNLILKNEISGDFYDFSFDNDFRRLIRMMAGVNTDLRTTIPPSYSNSIKGVLVDLIDYGIFPVSIHSDIEDLNVFCYAPDRRIIFLNEMTKEICR